MSKPIIFTMDDESTVLRALVRDLRPHYPDYRIVAAESSEMALETLHTLKARNAAVALFLVDQRMPGITGIEFLEKALTLYPTAKRVLLTAYADTDAAIRAINTVKLDFYLLKPWDPPEEQLFPVLDDLLSDWRATYHPAFEGIRVLGHRWSPQVHQIKDFLARNLVPYRWLNVDNGSDAYAYADLSPAELPVVLLPDGSRLSQPSLPQLAQHIGLKTQATAPFYDLIIVGAGPAGLGAAVYGASEGLRTLLIDAEAPGGQAGTSSRIENYLGFPSGLSGADLTRRAVAQARRLGAEILAPQTVAAIRQQDDYRIVTLADGNEVRGYAVLIATGVSYRQLAIPGIEALHGAGVYYGAAMSEAKACQGQDVFVVGGGNSAGQAAMYLANYARSVTILIRGESLTTSMSHYLIEQIEATSNIHLQNYSDVVGVQGEKRLEMLSIRRHATNEIDILPAAALFIFIGARPRTDWLPAAVQRDGAGYVLAGSDIDLSGWTLSRAPLLLETGAPGIFVAGDVRHGSVKRVASAVGEGAMAVRFVHEYLRTLEMDTREKEGMA